MKNGYEYAKEYLMNTCNDLLRELGSRNDVNSLPISASADVVMAIYMLANKLSNAVELES